MSSAGTNGTDGTDLTTTLTTQGDIVYRDASGLARLGAGTAGEALITNGTGANPSWGSVAGGKILQVQHGASTPQTSTTSTSFVDLSTNTNVIITPSATSSKILVLAHFNELYHSGGSNTTSHYIRVTRAGNQIAKAHTIYTQNLGGEEMHNQDFMLVDQPNTTSAIEYKLQFHSSDGNQVRVNQNGNDGGSTITLLEIGA
jgi:hypothetical protein